METGSGDSVSTSNVLTVNEKENTDDLFNQLYDLCEEAYANGIDSVDIYNVLHSKELLIEAAQRKKCQGQSQISSDINFANASFAIFRSIFSCLRWIQFLLTVALKSASVVLKCLLCVLICLVGTLFVCHKVFNFDVNPLIYFPSWAEKQCLLPAHPVILEMVRPIEDCSICQNYLKTNSVSIEFESPPSKSDFLSVAYTSRPIVVRGAAFGNGMPRSFSFESLKKVFESEPGGVDSVSDECQFLPFRSPFMSLSEAFELISDSATWNKPWYIGWSNCHPGVASKLRKIFPRPDFLPVDSESSAIDWFFIGSPGLGASMHIDYVRRPSWQAQLSGTKKWILKPPPECEEQCNQDISFVIHPGDMVFVDTNVWFHETQIEGEKLSISIGSEYD